MKFRTPLIFGTAEITHAMVDAHSGNLRLSIREGRLNTTELRMLIDFLKAKLDQLDSLDPRLTI
jgi:hypothetical protein